MGRMRLAPCVFPIDTSFALVRIEDVMEKKKAKVRGDLGFPGRNTTSAKDEYKSGVYSVT